MAVAPRYSDKNWSITDAVDGASLEAAMAHRKEAGTRGQGDHDRAQEARGSTRRASGERRLDTDSERCKSDKISEIHRKSNGERTGRVTGRRRTEASSNFCQNEDAEESSTAPGCEENARTLVALRSMAMTRLDRAAKNTTDTSSDGAVAGNFSL
jgi:hypothetical protein